MYVPIEPQPTSAQGWLAAATAVQCCGGEAHNVVIDIADPLAESGTDAEIISEVDAFLRGHHRNSLNGVANTIFPQSTYDRHGPEAFYGVYRETVLPRMKQMTRDWGRYFDRLTIWAKVRGSEVTMINPLDDLVKFMKAQVASERTYRNTYEMTIFDPARDAGKISNRQCLSFLSFKLTHENQLLLTVMYRNHAYIARGLGNFIGLGRLMAFVAEQTGTTLGSLTCISTHAEIDHRKNARSGVVEGWGLVEANALLDRCRLLNTSGHAA
jgi:thymidylate synthase